MSIPAGKEQSSEPLDPTSLGMPSQQDGFHVDPCLRPNIPKQDWFRLARTLSHLTPRQLFYNALRRSFKGGCPKAAAAEPTRGLALMEPPLARHVYDPKDGSLCFLNVKRVMDPDQAAWSPEDVSKLWRYNLHYFDYLCDPHLSTEAKGMLIDSWIEKNPCRTVDAWEPYPLSLRLVNWIKYFCQTPSHKPLDETWLKSLFLQAEWLTRNLEYHICANHLFKNCVALLYAGSFFSGPRAETWLAQGCRLLRDQLSEQLLPDGGHYERSPMYHAIFTEDLLDLVNLTGTGASPLLAGEVAALRAAASNALAFLDDVVFPDEQIALFNDSAFGIAPLPKDLFAYGRTLVGFERSEAMVTAKIIERTDSGYFGLRKGGQMVLMDAGPMGPDHQPGHGHCDALSYELMLEGRRIVVDSGVFAYEVGDSRQYFRSTAAHNTVRVDGQEQSEIWSAFRVGRRARPSAAVVTQSPDGALVVEAAHDGYERGAAPIRHQRRLEFVDRSLRVEDKMTGRGQHVYESFIHLHPDIDVVLDEAAQSGTLLWSGETIGRIIVEERCRLEVTSGAYAPEFGRCRENKVLVMRAEGEPPLRMYYRIDGEVLCAS
ncbi:MAG: alginate lyase family protein [Pseudomonadota bacterium]